MFVNPASSLNQHGPDGWEGHQTLLPVQLKDFQEA
jgi:hypothetical protein